MITEMNLHDKADKEHYITANTMLNLAQRARKVFESSEVAEKRQLLNFLLQNLELKGRKLLFNLKTPFDTVLLANKCPSMLRGWDSNPRPIDYTNPKVSFKRGLYHLRNTRSKALPSHNVMRSTPFQDSL